MCRGRHESVASKGGWDLGTDGWGQGSRSLGSCPVTISAPFRRTPTWRPNAKLSWPRSSNRTGASRRKWGRRFNGRNRGALADNHVLPDLGPKSQPRLRLRSEL